MIGATNRPFDLDEAALRRLTKRIYIGLPDAGAREGQIQKLLSSVTTKISKKEMSQIVLATNGYSSADLTALVKEVAMCPLREIPPSSIVNMNSKDLRPVNKKDFIESIKVMPPSVSQASINEYVQWNENTK